MSHIPQAVRFAPAYELEAIGGFQMTEVAHRTIYIEAVRTSIIDAYAQGEVGEDLAKLAGDLAAGLVSDGDTDIIRAFSIIRLAWYQPVSGDTVVEVIRAALAAAYAQGITAILTHYEDRQGEPT